MPSACSSSIPSPKSMRSRRTTRAVREVAALFREVARRGDCAVLLIHHTSKPAAASSDAFAGNQNAARGASSLTGVARVVQTLFAMSERDADKLGVVNHERRLWVRLDDAKATCC